jgi:hypothetical protein
LALVPRLARKAVDNAGDAWDHPRVSFGARSLIVAHDPTCQGDPSTVDADLDAVARNGEIPMQRRHDGELDPLVASPLPIVLVVCSKLELRGDAGWVANRNDGLACSFVRIFPRNFVRIFPRNALQLMSPLSLRLGVFPAAQNAKVDTWFRGGCIRNRQPGQPGLCKRNPRSFWEFMVCGNKRPMNAARGMRHGNQRRQAVPSWRNGQ